MNVSHDHADSNPRNSRGGILLGCGIVALFLLLSLFHSEAGVETGRRLSDDEFIIIGANFADHYLVGEHAVGGVAPDRTEVRVMLDGTEVGRDNTPFFNLWCHLAISCGITWHVPFVVRTPGTHSIVAEAYDLYGHHIGTTEAHQITFTLPAAPILQFIEPDGSYVRLLGSCDPGTYFRFEIDGTAIHEWQPCQGNGTWSNSLTLSTGKHLVVLTPLDRQRKQLAAVRKQTIEVPDVLSHKEMAR